MNWKEVVRELDHPGLVITNKAALRLIVQALHRGIQEEFPIENIYRLWNNTEAQVHVADNIGILQSALEKCKSKLRLVNYGKQSQGKFLRCG